MTSWSSKYNLYSFTSRWCMVRWSPHWYQYRGYKCNFKFDLMFWRNNPFNRNSSPKVREFLSKSNICETKMSFLRTSHQGSQLTGVDTPSQRVILQLISCRPQDSKTDQHQPIDNRYFVSVAKRKRSRKTVTYGARSIVLMLFVTQFLQERYF